MLQKYPLRASQTFWRVDDEGNIMALIEGPKAH